MLLEFLKKEVEQEITCYSLWSVYGYESSCKVNLVLILTGKKVLVQGIGHVGETLVDYLTKKELLLRLLISMKKTV
jgi:glutamate dehydrogenase/leucine dehydrogenase